MTGIFVSSKNVNWIGHDPNSNELHIQFNSGKTYAYEGFPASEYVRIVNEERPSKAAMDAIKNKKYRVV